MPLTGRIGAPAAKALVQTPTGKLIVPTLEPASDEIRLSIVIPTYNESANLGELLLRLAELFTPVLGNAYELIVVDDDSPDDSWKLALDLSERLPQVSVLRRQGERGLSSAVIRGWQVARGKLLGVIDGDLQHPPEVSLDLLRELESGVDLAIASRNVQGGGVSDWRFSRRIISRGAQALGFFLLPSVLGRLSDPMSGFFMLHRSSIAGVELDPIGYKILVEIVARCKIRGISEVGYVFRERRAGSSKVTLGIYLEYVQHLLRLRQRLHSAART